MDKINNRTIFPCQTKRVAARAPVVLDNGTVVFSEARGKIKFQRLPVNQNYVPETPHDLINRFNRTMELCRIVRGENK